MIVVFIYCVPYNCTFAAIHNHLQSKHNGCLTFVNNHSLINQSSICICIAHIYGLWTMQHRSIVYNCRFNLYLFGIRQSISTLYYTIRLPCIYLMFPQLISIALLTFEVRICVHSTPVYIVISLCIEVSIRSNFSHEPPHI